MKSSLALLVMLALVVWLPPSSADPLTPEDPVGPVPIDSMLEFDTQVILHPCATSGAKFGSAVEVLDLDGDGEPELAVGASVDCAVYLMKQFGGVWAHEGTLGAEGVISCPAPRDESHFGAELSSGDFDGDGVDELVVGAPHTEGSLEKAGAAYAFDVDGADIVFLPTRAEEGKFGQSICVGDFDDDGELDLAVAAPTSNVPLSASGRVIVYLGPLSETSEKIVLDNPDPVVNGNFGHVISVNDWDQDGKDDLVVSAIGNTVGGEAIAGNVYVFPGPVAQSSYVELNDPAPIQGDLPRYGMSLDARGNRVGIGSPRKDFAGIVDTGLGVSFLGPAAVPIQHMHPQPFDNAILGYRVLWADVVGDSKPDLAIASLPSEGTTPSEMGDVPFINRGLYIWPSGGAGQAKFLPAAADSQNHFPTGIAAGQLEPGGYEEIVLGDPTWDPSGSRRGDNTGRVVVYFAN